MIEQAEPSRQFFETVNFAFMKIFDPFHKNQRFQKINDRNWANASLESPDQYLIGVKEQKRSNKVRIVPEYLIGLIFDFCFEFY